MSEILIVAEQVDSHVSKPTLELLTLARRLGEPVAVVFSETDEAVAKTLAEYGATRVLFVADPASRTISSRRRPKRLRRSPPMWTRPRS